MHYAIRARSKCLRSSRQWTLVLQSVVLLVITWGGSAVPAKAGAPNIPCDKPFVYSGAAVNVVILPYRYTGPRNTHLSEAATRLSLLIHVDTLFSIIKYRSIGGVRLVEVPEFEGECQPDIVLAKLLGKKKGAKEEIKPGYGVVLLWGRIYVEGNDIYLQSYLRFLRRGITEQLELGVGDQKFVGRLPSQVFAFAPRRLTLEDLAQFEEEFARSAIVRDEPNETAHGEPMPLDPDAPFPYWVTEVQGDWIRIEPHPLAEGGPSGWIRARVAPLRRKMPELSFLEAIVGFLRYRGAQEGSGPVVPSHTVYWVEEALRRYERDSGSRKATLATAVGKAVNALLKIESLAESPASYVAAQCVLEKVVTLVPYSADARNLEVMTRIYLAYNGWQPGMRQKAIAADLLRAAALDPQNPLILANLENLYDLFLKATPPPYADLSGAFERDELQRRLKQVHEARVETGTD